MIAVELLKLAMTFLKSTTAQREKVADDLDFRVGGHLGWLLVAILLVMALTFRAFGFEFWFLAFGVTAITIAVAELTPLSLPGKNERALRLMGYWTRRGARAGLIVP